MKYLISNFKKTWEFMSESKGFYLDVLLMHGFIMFFFTPFLVSVTQFILRQGGIPYISYDNLGVIMSQHPFVFLGLIGMLLLLVVSVFFEFTFLLLSVYFIKIRKKISLRQLLKGTFLQLKKISIGALLFFLFYFFLVLPLSGIKFNSELLAKFQIPVFILDVIFENRVLFIALFILFYIILIYLAIRFIFALPEMILKDRSFKESVKFSWEETKGNFLKVLIQFVIVMGSFTLISGLVTSLMIYIQHLIEANMAKYALGSAIVLMTGIQVVWLLSLVFSLVGIFFVTIDYLGTNNFLPETLSWYKVKTQKEQASWMKFSKGLGMVLLVIGLTVVVGTANAEFLSNPASVEPIRVSHRGVDNGNGAQNSIDALVKTSTTTHPDYVEMDIQETKDQKFVVFHDFNMKALTGTSVKPNQLTLEEATKLTVKDNGKEEPVASFDDYLAKANEIDQKLMIEIKPTKDDTPEMIDNFIEMYSDNILEKGHVIQSLSFDIVEELKKKAPEMVVGYIMPFSVVGPPEGEMDFFTLEYTTLNANFIKSANAQGKDVYAWTPNDEETMSRMMFYGIDGMITDQMELLNETITDASKEDITYSDKLLYFVIGIG